MAFVLAHCPRGRALDVGCGTGMLAARLAASGYEMAGIDPSEGMLEVLRERTPAVEAVRAEGTAIPFPDDSFDLVLSVAVMHHIADAADVRAHARGDGPRDEARAGGSSCGTTTRAIPTGAC